jgi:Kef-type K+ transport system membrane component KefB
VDLLAHSIAQGLEDPLVPLDPALAVEFGRDDGGEEVAPVALDRQVLARKPLRDEAPDVVGSRIGSHGTAILASTPGTRPGPTLRDARGSRPGADRAPTFCMPQLTNEIAYLVLIVGLMVIPRVVQRWRIPAPLTCFGFGMAGGVFLTGFSQDATLALLATLGISSLFLFAGLEIDLADLARGKWPLLGHLVVRSTTLAGGGWLAMHYFGFGWQPAALLALALLTPSTGFILETLSGLGLSDEERYWVTIKAVGGELLALAVLFVVLQSSSMERLAWSSGALLAMIVGLPLLFMLLGRVVAPHAPGSEFSLLVMVGLIASYLTYQLGVYYLVGAFLAGFIARMLRHRMPMLASDTNLRAIQLFASFFVPFYFFYKGMGVPADALTLAALQLGILLTVATLPFRIGALWLQRRFIRGETAMGSLRVATALTPTLIFTLVLATILRERFHVSDTVYGALLFYAAVSTVLPSLLLGKPLDFDPTMPREEARAAAVPSAAQAERE